jgi:histidinol dehydrogenase
MILRIIQSRNPLTDPAIAAVRERLLRADLTAGGSGLDVPGIVRKIIDDVRLRGDRALVDWELRLDKVRLTPKTLRVDAGAIARAHRAADASFLGLVRRVAANIRQYQKHILVKAPPALKRGGRTLGVRYTPIERVGVYVPGGTAVYPSSVLMTIVPAQVAGVKQIAMASPPRSDGDVSPLVLALAGELGITEVYRLGGAPAVAALALGTPAVPRVFKILGPGNAFVVEAKRQLFGRVGIDSTAGPSEVLIVADDTARSDWLAADLIAQAEHNPGSAVLVTPSLRLARQVAKAVDGQIAGLERGQAARQCLKQYGAIIVVKDVAQACELASDFAPEHLQIITADDRAALARIRNAGAIFLGAHTPVPLGDYYAGPSHVLPTGGTAKFFGPLSCNDFMKASSVESYSAAALKKDAADVIDFATREGLTGHAHAIRVRLERGRR